MCLLLWAECIVEIEVGLSPKHKIQLSLGSCSGIQAREQWNTSICFIIFYQRSVFWNKCFFLLQLLPLLWEDCRNEREDNNNKKKEFLQ